MINRFHAIFDFASRSYRKTIGVDSTYRLKAREKSPPNDKRAHTYGIGYGPSLTSRRVEISHVSKSRQSECFSLIQEVSQNKYNNLFELRKNITAF